MSLLKRYIPIIAIVFLVIVTYFTGLIDYLSIEEIKKNRDLLKKVSPCIPI